MAGKPNLLLGEDDGDLTSAPFRSLFLEAKEDLSEMSITDFLKNSEEQLTGKKINPNHGFCVKTKDSDGNKIFANVCYTNEIPAPKVISEEELREILNSDDPSVYRVPMSLGEGHMEKDKSGNETTAYDVIINDEFFKLVQSNEVFQNFVITAALEALADKYHFEVSSTPWIILKHKKYFGTMREQHIKERPKPLITELESSSKIPAVSALKVEKSVKNNEPDFILWSEFMDKDTNPALNAEIYLPAVNVGKSLDVQLGEDRIVVNSKANSYLLDIFLPYNINQEESSCRFNVKTKVLSITMPRLQAAS